MSAYQLLKLNFMGHR